MKSSNLKLITGGFMTNDQIELVQSSFRQFLPLADSAAKTFYRRLFALDSSLKALFTNDMLTQGNKLMQFLGLAVVSLNKLEQLQPTLRTLGARHVTYGVLEPDYDTVGRALLWTLERTLGDSFTPELEKSWNDAYAMISSEMKAGAATKPLPPLDLIARHRLIRSERQTRPL
jgi:hemoglobin-like flavoprotein